MDLVGLIAAFKGLATQQQKEKASYIGKEKRHPDSCQKK